jgi:hypothetical protein
LALEPFLSVSLDASARVDLGGRRIIKKFLLGNLQEIGPAATAQWKQFIL